MRRSSTFAKVCSPVPWRARNGLTKRPSPPVCICWARRPDVDVDAEIAGIISRFNESVGGVNDDSQGCHDTITCADVAGVRAFLLGTRQGQFVEQTNALLLSPVGARDWPMWFYSRSLLFSVAARQGLVEPDLAPFSTVIPAQAGIQGY